MPPSPRLHNPQRSTIPPPDLPPPPPTNAATHMTLIHARATCINLCMKKGICTKVHHPDIYDDENPPPASQGPGPCQGAFLPFFLSSFLPPSLPPSHSATPFPSLPSFLPSKNFFLQNIFLQNVPSFLSSFMVPGICCVQRAHQPHQRCLSPFLQFVRPFLSFRLHPFPPLNSPFLSPSLPSFLPFLRVNLIASGPILTPVCARTSFPRESSGETTSTTVGDSGNGCLRIRNAIPSRSAGKLPSLAV